MNSSERALRVGICTFAFFSLLFAAERPGGEEREGAKGKYGRDLGEVESTPGTFRGPVPIRPPIVKGAPAAGRGRMSIEFQGNRRWCTFRDDRLQKPPIKMLRGRSHPRDIYTFGYQFSIAAFERSDPSETLLLYSSPVIRTATLRQAAKLGRGRDHESGRDLPPGPERDAAPMGMQGRKSPAALVPYWDEARRCALLGEQFDFDLPPGTYDVYLSFDMMIRSGTWVRRSYGYLTGIDIREGMKTVVQGVVDMKGGGRRRVDLLSASIEPPAAASVDSP